MSKFLSTLSVLALLTSPLTAMAQDTSTEAPAQDSANTPADELPLGTEVVDENGPGTAYIRENTGDWGLECFRVEEGQEEPCQLFQALMDDQGNQVSNVRIFRLPDGGRAVAGALVAVPLETLLTAQLTIAVDGNAGKRYPFSVCDRLGCYARLGFTADDIAAFKRGKSATVSLVPFVAPDKPITLNMSLTGFTAGYEKATVAQN